MDAMKMFKIHCCLYIIWNASLVCHCLSRHKHFKINPSCYDRAIRSQENLESCWINIGLRRSGMDCASQCVVNNSCKGYMENSAKECILHKQCNELINVCIVENKADTSYYEKSDTFISCYNKGVWNSLKERCECRDGWVGKECERLAETCDELVRYHYLDKSVSVFLHPLSSPVPFRATCYLFQRGDNNVYYTSTVIFKNFGRSQTGYDFNKTWADYQTGYFDNQKWLGLENLYHLLQSAGSANRLVVRLRMESDTYSMIYAGFGLANSSLGYAFSFTTPTYHYGSGRPFYRDENITVQDCLTPIQGAKFSTFDNDNDEDASENCAALVGNGWWFRSCNAECNLFGKAYDIGGTETAFSAEHIRIGGVDMQRYAKNFTSLFLLLHIPI